MVGGFVNEEYIIFEESSFRNSTTYYSPGKPPWARNTSKNTMRVALAATFD
jgi:hypothetical protein